MDTDPRSSPSRRGRIFCDAGMPVRSRRGERYRGAEAEAATEVGRFTTAARRRPAGGGRPSVAMGWERLVGIHGGSARVTRLLTADRQTAGPSLRWRPPKGLRGEADDPLVSGCFLVARGAAGDHRIHTLTPGCARPDARAVREHARDHGVRRRIRARGRRLRGSARL